VLEVLKLDGECEHEVLVLRKSLMSQIGVEEYLHEMAWQNPCASFVLLHVFCSECHEARDLNLCVLPLEDENGDIKVRETLNHGNNCVCVNIPNPLPSNNS